MLSVDTRVPGVALVSLIGEHEVYGAPKLQERIDSLIAEHLSIVIDLTDTVFLDSSIVGVLLKEHQLAASKGVDYTIVLSKSTGEPVRRMFEITGLAQILTIVERDDDLPLN
jgi:anti-anti-sigma factor